MSPEGDNRPQKEGFFMISVAAGLAKMHPQTLRTYEQRRLIEPERTPRGTRLYSQAIVDRLRQIQRLTNEGINLNGVERIFELESRVGRLQRRVGSLERQLDQTRLEAAAEIERVRRSLRAEVVVYRPQSASLASLRRTSPAGPGETESRTRKIEIKREFEE